MLALSLAWCWLPCNAQAETKRERTLAAQEEVKFALEAEVRGYGMEVRADHLEAALYQAPEYEPAHWHAGQVRWGKEWVPAGLVANQVAKDPRYQAYLKIRERYAETVPGQWDLARWCAGHGLPDQQRAHLTKLLELDPDHAAARAALGFERVDGVWIDPRELATGGKLAEQFATDLRDWQPKCQRILKGLQQTSLARKKAAAEQMRAIDDLAAIPALEATFAAVDESIANLLVETLAGMTGNQATLALARQAVMSPWTTVQAAATLQLAKRPKDAYIPELLAALYSPVQSRAELYRGPAGRLMYRHVFFREGKEFQELAVLETAFRRQGVPADGGVDTLNRALLIANQQHQEREQLVSAQNAFTQEMNSRVCSVLSRTTGEALPAQPAAWWKWWNDYNEVYYVEPKGTRERYAQQEITLVDETGSGGLDDGPSGGSPPTAATPMDCLAKGTLVQTCMGPVAIDAVKVGDLVLSQDVQTGELAYKPVLRTTIRPVGSLVTIHVAGQTLTSSGGHLFWASGKGWVKARALVVGDILHHATGTVEVTSVEQGPRDQTYNLVVADFHNYFAGADRLLSHDNTIHERTDFIVPGLREE